jgi:toluene monooxygenase electron transfer component
MNTGCGVVVHDRKGAQALFSVATGERLLHAGLAAGLPLPYECASGTCGSCKATVLNGAVRDLWPQAPGKRFCRGAAEILMCQSAALDGVALSIKAELDPQERVKCGPMPARLVNRRAITRDILTFDLAIPGEVRHAAGQFVLLSAEGIDGPRAYSMTSFDPLGRRLSFLVRRKEGGAFTEALFSGRLDGQDVSLFGPLGRAVLTEDDERPFVAIAGGSGIAGMLSILEWAGHAGFWRRHRGNLFFGLREVASAYALDELAAHVRSAAGALKVTIVFSDAPAPSAGCDAYPELTMVTGLVHETAGKALAGLGTGQDAPLFFVAGPPPMVDGAMRMLVLDYKISPKDIRYDRFG